MRGIKHARFVVGVIVLTYLLGAFVTWKADPADWGWDIRLITMLAAAWLCGTVCFFPSED